MSPGRVLVRMTAVSPRALDAPVARPPGRFRDYRASLGWTNRRARGEGVPRVSTRRAPSARGYSTSGEWRSVAVGCALECGDVDLHLREHLGDGSTATPRVGVGLQFEQALGGHLPTDAEAVAAPAVLRGASTAREQRIPLAVGLRLVVAQHDERDGFRERRAALGVHRGELDAARAEGGDVELAVLHGALDHLTVGEDGGVELDGLGKPARKPEKRGDLLRHGSLLNM